MKSKILALAAVIAATLLSGCVVVPGHEGQRGYYGDHYERHEGRRGEDAPY